jgi:hypothetical protein
MQLPFRIQIVRRVEVHLVVALGFESPRLGDLIQLLARSAVMITDLVADRSLYRLGLPERSVQLTLLVKDESHKKRILEKLLVHGFEVRESVQ